MGDAWARSAFPAAGGTGRSSLPEVAGTTAKGLTVKPMFVQRQTAMKALSAAQNSGGGADCRGPGAGPAGSGWRGPDRICPGLGTEEDSGRGLAGIGAVLWKHSEQRVQERSLLVA